MQGQDFDFAAVIGHFFKAFGRRPGGMLWVAGWNAVLFTAFTAAIIWLVAPGYFNILEVAASGGDPSVEDVWGMLGPVLAIVPLSLLGGILVALLAQGAWLRLLVRDEVTAGIPYRLGGDELRLLAVNLAFILIGIAIYIVALGVGIALALAVGVTEGGAGAGLLAGLVGGLLVLLLIAFILFLAVRLSAAPALTVLDRRIRLFDAMGATRGIFWWLLLAYIVMAIIIFAAQMVFGTVIQFVFLGAFLPVLMEMSMLADSADVDPSVFLNAIRDQFSEPGALGLMAFGLFLAFFLQTLTEAAWHSIGAYTARRHRAPEAAPPAAAQTPPPAAASEPE